MGPKTLLKKKAILRLLHLKAALYGVIKMRGCYTNTTAHCYCLNSCTMKFYGTKRRKVGEVKIKRAQEQVVTREPTVREKKKENEMGRASRVKHQHGQVRSTTLILT